MSNEVTIKVKAKDDSDYNGIKRNAKGQFSKAGDDAAAEFTKSTKRGAKATEDEFAKSGDRSGNRFLSSVRNWFGKSKSEGSKSGAEAAAGFGGSIKNWFSGAGSSTFSKGATQVAKSFGGSMKKWFAGDGSKLFGEGGQIGGEAFSSGIGGMLKTPILGPILMTAFAAVIATVMPAIGAIAGGALVLGFGAGIAGLGIMMAAKSEAVKTAWSKTMGQVGADVQLLSKPFESTLVRISGIFQRTVNGFNPYLAKAFSELAGPIGDFADDAGHALEELEPAIGPITEGFKGVLDAVGGALPGLVKSLSSGMIELSNSVKENPQALADLVSGIGLVVSDSLHLITVLNDVNTGFSTMTGGLSLVEIVMAGVASLLAPLTATFTVLGKGIDIVNAALGRNGENADVSGKSMADAAAKTVDLANAHGGLATAAHGSVDPQTASAQAAELAAKSAADAKAKFEGYISAMFRAQGLSISLSAAQIGVQAATDAASASIKENGRNHDINSEKGRANKTALDALATATNTQTESMLRNGKGTAAAASAAESSKANFVSLAQKMGFSAGEARTMAHDMFAIPNVSREAKLVANKTDLENKLSAARHALADPKLTATKKAKLEAEVSRLMGAVNAAQNKIDGLHGKTVSVTIKYSSTGVNLTTPSRVGGTWHGGTVGTGMKGYAGGGNPNANESLVGEEGPEILTMSGGQARVTPLSNTRQRMRGMGGGAVQVELVVKAGTNAAEQFVADMVRQFVKVRGGNVQRALGQGQSA